MLFGEINWIIFQYTSLWEEPVVLTTGGGGSEEGLLMGRREGGKNFGTTGKEGELIMLFATLLHVLLSTRLQSGPFLLRESEIQPMRSLKEKA